MTASSPSLDNRRPTPYGRQTNAMCSPKSGDSWKSFGAPVGRLMPSGPGAGPAGPTASSKGPQLVTLAVWSLLQAGLGRNKDEDKGDHKTPDGL